MGHYVPQEYLGHFAPSSDPEKVWMLDKSSNAFRLSTDKSALLVEGSVLEVG